MGAFGVQFTGDKTVHPQKKRKRTRMPRTFVYQEPDPGFHKSLAYVSCFALMLVSLCLFVPDHMLGLIQTMLGIVS